MNRKAQSQIITTVLLILIVLAAVIIVWQVIKNFTTPGIEDQDDCFKVQLNFESVTCTGTTASGNVKRGPDNLGDLMMKFVVGDGSVDRDPVAAPSALGTVPFDLTGVSDGDTVVVSAMVGVNNDILCATSDQIELSCS